MVGVFFITNRTELQRIATAADSTLPFGNAALIPL